MDSRILQEDTARGTMGSQPVYAGQQGVYRAVRDSATGTSIEYAIDEKNDQKEEGHFLASLSLSLSQIATGIRLLSPASLSLFSVLSCVLFLLCVVVCM